jgi:ParB family chromosome partitioning protein
VTFNENKLLKYFPASYSTKEMEQVIESLLEKWKKEQEVE